MASKAAAKAAGNAMSISTKYTVQSTGIWERIRRATALDPNRSNGVPLNPYNRSPAPGSNPALEYDDPVTVPAGDIADNPYWKRDHRRNYPRLSVVGQAQHVALLTVGSAAAPRVELVGEAGTKALVAAEESGKAGGVAAYLEESGVEAAKRVLELTGGLPPLPSGECLASGEWDVHRYGIREEQSYSEDYPCRSFV
ncbi:21 kDa subunit of NADH dehydrogenase [Trichocladium antarcticum]|uniref:21 kDa subunit of NADH dehydrogenase n=1 Tax=Trichocladium antarcticum TaxID=1450529 RepID=A0AAN6ZIL2_9PEZI|nr:21 kDa subunit of NADH dehydrogenase [Trichocladium antarcticum]